MISVWRLELMWCHTLEMVCLKKGFGFKGGGKAIRHRKLLFVVVLHCSERCRRVSYVTRIIPFLGVFIPTGDSSSNTTISEIQGMLS